MEWPYTLDVAALADQGWTPRPFRNFILKIHSRCDLACDYCYMYNAADQGWRAQPLTMTRTVVRQAAERVAEHAGAHGLPLVNLVLHGGEPLLSGPDLIAHTVATMRAAVGPATRVRVSVQTNGMLLTDDYLRLFADLDVLVGVSLDGDRAAHDRHRRRRDGRGSHGRVAAAVRRLSEGPYRRIFGGLLCTVDLRNDPVGTYEELLRFRPPGVDFLLPHGNWTTPPPGRRPGSAATPYADWLIQVFDRWYGASPKETGVRIFEEIIHMLLGGAARVEGLGLEPMRCVVIETDGAIEQGDALKTAYAGATGTGLHVATASLDAALLLPPVVARQLGAAALGATCRSCAVRRVCGAGHYAHRYRAGSGFANPTVYCPDLYRLITHIHRRLSADVARLRSTTPA
ncbi:FxsB family cyclophane-forming radical SAM/SPASM peptide maturase [Sphaerisporangium fuscum]|uniref:FxsB family cyclophane-forming radical SAM/SPASM peptide maturase n=1 Tax=Sphaerisporangium fuscum TaxID=2835868 RepID=UPI001BDC7F7F|nr:FxsB family cyclophane-forming radical SAM/SPASM peptide maturase [Sphaerisporangium fuscum]